MPSAAAAKSRVQPASHHPQTPQGVFPPRRVMPAQPETLPDMSSNPTLSPENSRAVLGQSEITPPASNIGLPQIAQFLTGTTLVPAPLLPNLRLESFHTFRRYSDPQLAVQSKPQELAFPDPPCSAFGGIHLQSQMLLDPVPYRGQRAFRRRLTAYVDIAVIGIS